MHKIATILFNPANRNHHAHSAFFTSPTGSPGLAPIDIDVDGILRPVLAVGAAHVSSEWEQAPHRHRKAQLLYAVRGVIHCEVDSGAWIVPPQCAVWIPGGLLHAARGAGEAQCYCLFVEMEQAPQLPAECCTVAVSPLLRELIFKAAGFPVPSALDAAQERLVATLLDELAAAPCKTCTCRCRATAACASWRRCCWPAPATRHRWPHGPAASA